MKLLPDECVDERLRYFFEAHECHTVRYAGLAGLKNGALLLAAENAGFTAIITTDQGMSHQQNLASRHISIIVLCGRTNRIADLKPLAPAALRVMESIEPGQIVTISV